MQQLNRRTLLKGGLLPVAGLAGLPPLSPPWSRQLLHTTDPNSRSPMSARPKFACTASGTHSRVHRSGHLRAGRIHRCRRGNVPLIRSFARMLIGQDPLNIDAALERIRTSGIFAGAQGGQYVTALTGVEIALWDLAGKALGLPVYQFLGAKSGTACESTAIPARERSPGTSVQARIKRIQDRASRPMKIDIDDAPTPRASTA